MFSHSILAILIFVCMCVPAFAQDILLSGRISWSESDTLTYIEAAEGAEVEFFYSYKADPILYGYDMEFFFGKCVEVLDEYVPVLRYTIRLPMLPDGETAVSTIPPNSMIAFLSGHCGDGFAYGFPIEEHGYLTVKVLDSSLPTINRTWGELKSMYR